MQKVIALRWMIFNWAHSCVDSLSDMWIRVGEYIDFSEVSV